MRVLARFLLAATHVDHFPAPVVPEIAFLGRSNVGKSHLLNSLVNHKIARTSSTPGRTQSINFFEIRWPGNPRPDMLFADLPGYGYARVPRAVSSQWPGFIEPYLQTRSCLALCLALVDANVPPQQSDQQLVQFLRAAGRPFVIVATKTDKLSGNQARKSLDDLQREFAPARIISYSARTGLGREELWREIRGAVKKDDSNVAAV
ncbi:MAG TPA: ribosome biogenesis GTP-binding protein YihA/YsxC [Terriglobales bacterium]|nr:ribosome biogenesis GTP-binding protein YihA/YsxC [Terriglobales bacterium]